LIQFLGHSNIDKIYQQGIVDALMKKLHQPDCSDIIFVAACELLAQLCKGK
jgi:S-adenosylmethionine:tRNA-ribosyltransferase-isomerase (queuine synthetase)